MFKKHYLLIYLLFLSLFIRIYDIKNVPPGPSLDEVSIGYNAYSILKTGRDEYGILLPTVLRAYDDYRPILYVYLTVPFVAVFGLTPLAIRFPSVILGVMAVWGTYLLAKELTSKSQISNHKSQIDKKTKLNNTSDKYWNLGFVNWNLLPLISSLLMAISPWHIYLSRLGHEVNLGLTVMIFALYFFIRFINDVIKQKFLILSSIFFALSFYTYQSQKIVIPVIVLALTFIYRKILFNNIYKLLLPVLTGLIILIPFIYQLKDPNTYTRFRATNDISSNPLYISSMNEFVVAKSEGDIWKMIINNRRLVAVRIVAGNYFSHFNLKWLYFGGPMESHKVPGIGLFYVWELIFFIIGLYVFIKTTHISLSTKILLAVWFMSGPFPASITTQAPHAMRAFSMLPVSQIIEAMGISYIFARFYKYRTLTHTLFAIVVFISIYRLSVNYFMVFPKTQSQSFQVALSDAMKEIHQVDQHVKTNNR